MSQTQLNHLIEAATTTLGLPYSSVSLPKAGNGQNSSNSTVSASALWTRDGLRPRWQNIAVVADKASTQKDIDLWIEVLGNLSVPLGMLAFQGEYLFLSRTPPGQIELREVAAESLEREIGRCRDSLFTPQALAKLKTGQLSFADLDESVSEGSFTFLTRQKAKLDEALQTAIIEALNVQLGVDKDEATQILRPSPYEAVLMVSIAYLAARVLEDKGFFGPRMPTNDPWKLLHQTLEKKNGFFQKAVNEYLPHVNDGALQSLARHLGANVTFSLVDHHDVGHLYEKAVQVLQQLPGIDSALSDLQQHYTPIALAERMVELLPLERLSPENRIIFDPAAGSGSLLLAASSRLAAMSDIPNQEERAKYLAKHVVGNDLDPVAELVTKLRYSLVQETFGDKGLFPEPDLFGHMDYTLYNKATLPNTASVIIANPPFAEDGSVQRAVRFVELVMGWLKEGNQFALILPLTFLTGSTHGIKEARELLGANCHLLELWQLPEGAIGLSARQPVCVALGKKGLREAKPTLARAVLSNARTDIIRDKGFLGQAWFTASIGDSQNWDSVVAPQIEILEPTVPLNDLYFLYSGVTPTSAFPPIGNLTDVDIKVKRYWKLSWRETGRLWIDPEKLPAEERFIRYTKEHLRAPGFQFEPFYDLPKIMIGRSINQGSNDLLAARLDTVGFCPNNDVYCISSRIQINKPVSQIQILDEWLNLDEEEQLLWLLGILSSNLAVDLSLRMRDSRHLISKLMRKFPLPVKINREIIDLTRTLVNRDQKGEPIPYPDTIRVALNEAVEASYGNPTRLKLIRTDPLPEIEQWQGEQRKPSVTVTGLVLDVNPGSNQVHLYLEGLLDDEESAWIPLPPELPGWALDGTVFEAELSQDVDTFHDLKERPWAIRDFKHTPRPYMSIEQLEAEFAAHMDSES